MLLQRLFKGASERRSVEQVYEAIVDQARDPAFYLEFGVEDAFEPRFELLILHAHLVIRRLSREGGRPARFAQRLFDVLAFDMDRTLRSMGVGDMSVGKKVKDMMRAYYGRTAAYEDGLASGDRDRLEQALARNVFGLEAPADGCRRLAGYVVASSEALSAQSVDRILAGEVAFPAVGDQR